MQGDERESTSNFLDDRILAIWQERRNRGSVADYHHPFWRNTLRDNAVAHVVAENYHARSLQECPAVHFLPAINPAIGPHDISTYGHIRIQIPNVVNERAIRHTCNECTGNARYGRVRHRKNDVG